MVAVVATAALLYPFSLGLVAAINPCGFPLLLVYLNFFTGSGDGTPPSAIGRAVRGLAAGSLATLGFVVLFGSIGIVAEFGISAATGTASAWARWLMVAFGVLMVVVGLVTLLGKSVRIRLPEVRPGIGLRRPVALFVFGIAYGIASIGCALPLFIGGVAGSFTQSGFLKGCSDFVAYALGMGVLLTVLAVVVAIAGPAAARRIRVVSRAIPIVGGTVLVAVGAYVTFYWVTAIFAPTDSFAPVRVVESLQGEISNLVGAHPVGLGIVLGAVVIAVLIAYAMRGGMADRERMVTHDGPATSNAAGTRTDRGDRKHQRSYHRDQPRPSAPFVSLSRHSETGANASQEVQR
jgi:cytochrome c biogenesis protein CcdA